MLNPTRPKPSTVHEKNAQRIQKPEEPKAIQVTKEYYVYKHTFADGSVYIGKGTGNRLNNLKKGRSGVYLELIDKFGPPTVVIIKNGLTENEAFQLENNEIKNSRAHGCKSINRTDGLEKIDIGSMPPRTLLFCKNTRKKIHPKYKQIVHIKNIKMDGSYSIGLTIIDAAIKTGTTCDRLIELLNKDPGLIIGDFKFISHEEAIRAAPMYENAILNAVNEAISALYDHAEFD